MTRSLRVRRATVLGAASVIALSAVGVAYADVTDEIVVTARKREESLQDIPVSGVVIGKDFIDDFALEGTRDFIRFVPGAIVTANGGPEFRDDITIRGAGTEAVESTQSATSLNRNGIFVGNGTFFGRSFTQFDLFDAQRLEVFRGPQAALFGRNAVGGAVNVVTNKPKFEHEGSLKVRYEVEQETKRIEAIENFPINDKVAVRLGALWDKRAGGFIKADDAASPLDGENFDAAVYQGARIQVRTRPTDDLDINLTAEFSHQESASFANLLYKPARDVGVGKFGRRGFQREDAQTTTETANIFLEADWSTSIGTLNTTLYFQNRRADAQDDFDAFNLTMPGGATFQTDATRTDHFQKFAGEVYLQSEGTGDLRWLAGADFQIYEDNFEQFAPIFYASTGIGVTVVQNNITLPAPYNVVLSAGFPPGVLPAGFQLTMAMSGAFATIPFLATAGGGTGLWIEGFQADTRDDYRNLTRRSRSYSAFGSVEYDAFEDVTVSGEVRVTHNRLEGIFQSLTTFSGTAYSGGPIVVSNPVTMAATTVTTGAGNPAGATASGVPTTSYGSGGCLTNNTGVTALCAGSPIGPVTATLLNANANLNGVREPSKEDLRVTPVGTIKYDLGGDSQVYGRVGVAFRPEDYAPNTNPPTEYDTETVVSYEVGYKGGLDLWGGRVLFDSAIYYTHSANYQQVTVGPNEFTGQLTALIENVGDAWTVGGEFGARGSWPLFDGRFQSQFSASSSYGEIQDGSPVIVDSITMTQVAASTKGNRIPGTRDYQFLLTGGYFAPLPNTDLSWFTNLAFTAQGGGYQNAFNGIELKNFEDFTGSLGLRGENWRAQLFGRNLTNEIYELQRFSTANGLYIVHSQPRTWGAEVSFNW
ncbi:MAG: TonB-dependent receptor plug domain-containing protein [Alphaproteobacteria bacterium]|nr:TonB-dependent receptor plug domain-containing protein [Alphaproteobacteria bacterium]